MFLNILDSNKALTFILISATVPWYKESLYVNLIGFLTFTSFSFLTLSLLSFSLFLNLISLELKIPKLYVYPKVTVKLLLDILVEFLKAIMQNS